MSTLYVNTIKPQTGTVVAVSGSLEVSGTINAYELKTITVSDTDYLGSTSFGNSSADTHQFTGSVFLSGSGLTIHGAEAGTATISLKADQADNPADTTTLSVADGGVFTITPGGGSLVLAGTTPKLTVGDGGAEDTMIVFDGNAIDYYVGLDDTDDKLHFGEGSTAGTTSAFSIDTNQQVSFKATTASTTTSTGGAIFAGGVGIADDLVVGDNVSLLSDSAVLSFGAGNDVTFTHDGGTGMDITSAGALDIKSTVNSEGCITIEADGGANETISIHSDQGTGVNTAAGTTDASINLISDVGGIGLYSGKNGDNAVRIEENGGTDGTIVLHANQGLGVNTAGNAYNASISLYSDGGGIGLYSGFDNDNAIRLESNGGVDETIVIHSNLGTGEDHQNASILLVSDVGGIGLTATGLTGVMTDTNSDAAVQLTALVGGIGLRTTSNLAGAIQIEADGGVAETIIIKADQSTVDGAAAAGAIQLLSDAGGIGLSWADGKDLWAEGGRAVITANEDAADCIKLHADAGTSQTITLVNDAGTSESAIAITSTAGGVDINAAAGKDVDIAGGQVLVTSAHNTANAIYLRANSGTSETIQIHADQGNTDGSDGAGSILAISDAGGIGFRWADDKDLWAEGGRAVITANEDAADCIKLHADDGTSQTITIVNDAGTDAAAIALTATAGGITFSADTATFTSAASTDPLVVIKNTNSDANGARLQFVKDKGAAGADGDDIGIIEFVGDDAAQTQTTFAKIVAEVSEADNTDEAGKLTLYVAESDGTNTALAAGLVLEGEHATDGQVDVTIAAGSASTTTVAGQLVTVGRIIETMSVTDNDAQNNTLSAAEIKGGIVVHTSATGGGTVTTDTASNIVSGIPLTADGQCIKCYYINDGGEDLTFAGGTGVTVADTGQLCLEDEGVILILRRTGATAVTMYTIGGDAAGE